MLNYSGIDNTILTFIADDSCAVGAVCKLSGAAAVTACDEGDGFLGVVQQLTPGGLGGVAVRGVVRVPFSGTAPALGWAKLSADGSGGVKTDAAGGREYLVLRTDSTAQTAEIYL